MAEHRRQIAVCGKSDPRPATGIGSEKSCNGEAPGANAMSTPLPPGELKNMKAKMVEDLEKYVETGDRKALIKAEALRLIINYHEKKTEERQHDRQA